MKNYKIKTDWESFTKSSGKVNYMTWLDDHYNNYTAEDFYNEKQSFIEDGGGADTPPIKHIQKLYDQKKLELLKIWTEE